MTTLGPNGFNADDHPPLTRPDPLPAGRYLAAVVESQLRATRAGDGQFVELRFQILEGEQRGRSVYARLNLWNPSEAAVAMAHSELASICRAVGVRQVSDTQALHEIPVFIEIAQEVRRDNGRVGNVIRGYTSRVDVFGADGTAGSTARLHGDPEDHVQAPAHPSRDDHAPWAAS